MSSAKADAKLIVRDREERLEAMPWRELIPYGTRREWVIAPSGRRFLVKTYTFWDMDEFASGMECGVRVYPESGWRRWWRYRGWVSRGGPDDWFEPADVEVGR